MHTCALVFRGSIFKLAELEKTPALEMDIDRSDDKETLCPQLLLTSQKMPAAWLKASGALFCFRRDI